MSLQNVVIVGKLAELESLVQLASVLTAIVNGPFTVNSYALQHYHILSLTSVNLLLTLSCCCYYNCQ